jgi:hypothetical protein
MKLNDYDLTKEFFGLFVGRSGSGKSVAEASFPKPLYVFDCDKRIDGIKSAAPLIDDIDKIEFDYYPPIGGFEKLNKKLEEWKMYRLSGQGIDYKTVTLDSLFALCRLCTIFSHKSIKGKMIGPDGGLKIRVDDPADYGFEANAVHQVFDELRSHKCNIIASAHIIDKWGRPPGEPYADSEIVGEKLTIRDKLGENIQTYFSNVFRFDRKEIGGEVKYFVQFAGDLAKNGYGLPPGSFDITDKNFYKFLLELIELKAQGKLEKKVKTDNSSGFLKL